MTQTTEADRELLAAAAKAAGIPSRVVGAAPGYYALYPDTDEVERFCCMSQWNPLADDGDALRLAVKLKLKLTIGNGITMAEAIGRPDVGVEFYEGAEAATRRAIVRAAAALATPYGGAP